MEKDESEYFEYLNLPDDPEEAFAIIHIRKYKELEEKWEADNQQSGWYYERRYVYDLISFDEVHDLNFFNSLKPIPLEDNKFGNFFHRFVECAHIASRKIMMEAARRQKSGAQNIVVLDAASRQGIHQLIDAIKEKLNELDLTESMRESLFGKLNAFASELDRNRTRTEAIFAFAVQFNRIVKDLNIEIKPVQKTLDRVLDWLDKAQTLAETLPSWSERRSIESPRKNLPSPKSDLDDEIPF